ncbi:MAG: sigma-70 family RNA polymerase sigma factor, partial [Chloroflexi bacterium]|nr:sigma-70 family RNA polymerase sigma factor [Chloroflexota bacterium]
MMRANTCIMMLEALPEELAGMALQTESWPSELASASDAYLVSLCLARSEGAWRALVARHGRLVYAVARQAGLREDDAADVVQTVFLALLEHLPALRRPGQLRAWLVTTGKRAAWRVAARALPSI